MTSVGQSYPDVGWLDRGLDEGNQDVRMRLYLTSGFMSARLSGVSDKDLRTGLRVFIAVGVPLLPLAFKTRFSEEVAAFTLTTCSRRTVLAGLLRSARPLLTSATSAIFEPEAS